MFTFKALSATAAAAALLTATTASAATNPAARLSLAPAARSSSATAHGNRLGAEVPTTTLISIGILAALVVIVLVATKSDGAPSSP